MIPQAQVYRSMAIRRLVLFGAAIVLGVVLGLVAIAREDGAGVSPTLGAFGGLWFLVCLVLTLAMWRCPACGRFLGRRWFIAACPGCRAKLQ